MRQLEHELPVRALRQALQKPNREGAPSPEVELNESGRVFVKWPIKDNLTEYMIKRGVQLDVVRSS